MATASEYAGLVMVLLMLKKQMFSNGVQGGAGEDSGLPPHQQRGNSVESPSISLYSSSSLSPPSPLQPGLPVTWAQASRQPGECLI